MLRPVGIALVVVTLVLGGAGLVRAGSDDDAAKWWSDTRRELRELSGEIRELFGEGGYGETALEQIFFGKSLSHPETRKALQQAAELGETGAKFTLGVIHAKGLGVAQDFEKAIHWFRAAAREGHLHAQYMLGVFYEQGRGARPDALGAYHWFRRAAEQGLAQAQYSLGLLYRDGRGVPRDRAEATVWFRRAADQGHVEAQEQLQ